MNVAVYSLTCGRLEYTKHCLKSLEEKAWKPYSHYVVDNGSTDGTVEWLKENESKFKKVIYNSENKGIGVASNQALDEIYKGDFDIVVKIDNDCEIVSDNMIGQIEEIFGGVKCFAPKYILSPRVEGIVNQPTRARYTTLAGRKIGITSMVGGLFMATPAQVFKDFRYSEKMMRIGQDSEICAFARHNGAECGYIEGLVVNHYETTDGQAKRYPDYFKIKWEEEKIDKQKL